MAKTHKIRTLKIVGVVLACLLALQILGLFSRRHLYVNLTPSVPVGLYKVEPLEGDLKRGDLVLFSPPKEFEPYIYGRKWLPIGWPLLKNVGGLPGDTFCVRGVSFTIEGRYIAKVYPVDHEGRPLPRFEGCRQVRPGHFLPIGTHAENSFDGRYMGDVATWHVKAKAKPVFIF